MDAFTRTHIGARRAAPLRHKSIDLAALGALVRPDRQGFRLPIPRVESRLAIYVGTAFALTWIIIETLWS